MHFDVLIRGGHVATGEGLVQADVAISGSKIAAVGVLSGSADEIVDAGGLVIFPGIIDTQVHFREPGMQHKEDIESGTRAAVMGGVTTILEMPNTLPPTTTPEALQDKLRRADGRAWCNYGFFVGASAENVSRLREMESLPGTPGVKIFMGSSTGSLLVPDDDNLRAVLREGKKRVAVHAEDHYRLEERKSLLIGDSPAQHPYLRDEECVRRATERLLRLSQETGRPVHVLHVSTSEELPLIRDAKAAGLRNTAEITPQHLFFSAPSAYALHGTRVQMNPPIREESHRRALRQAFEGGLFDVVGSDHAPHTAEEKAQPYPKSPSGIPGVQTMLPVMLTLAQKEGLCTISELVQRMCHNPARLFGMREKGYIREGFDADLTLVDLESRWTIELEWLQSKAGWSPFVGEEMRGRPLHVFVRGTRTVADGELIGTPYGNMVSFDN